MSLEHRQRVDSLRRVLEDLVENDVTIVVADGRLHHSGSAFGVQGSGLSPTRSRAALQSRPWGPFVKRFQWKLRTRLEDDIALFVADRRLHHSSPAFGV